jgi:uncharacterized C2H2 Zn-finger protein
MSPNIGDATFVRRADVLDFPARTVELILDLQRSGWRATRTNNNHVTLLAPDGVTRLSASRNSNSWKYVSEEVKRWRAQNPGAEPEPELVPAQKWPCPRCNKVFATDEHLSRHIHVDHEHMLDCPDCGRWFLDKRRLNLHRSKEHGYESPTKAARLAAKRKRDVKAKQQQTVIETVKQATQTIATVLSPNLDVATHHMMKDEQLLRVRVADAAVFVANSQGAFTLATAPMEAWEAQGWVFEPIKPPIKDVIAGLADGTMFTMHYEDGSVYVMQRCERDLVLELSYHEEMGRELPFSIDSDKFKGLLYNPTAVVLLGERVW